MEKSKGITLALSTGKREAPYDALILDAVLRQSLVSVRSLGRQGLRVAASETNEHRSVPTFSSHWCRQKIVCPAREGTEHYLTYLKQILDRTETPVVIASSDGTIALLRKHRRELERQTSIALAQEPALAIAVDKEQTLRVAQQLGIAVPPSIAVRAMDDVAAAIHEIGLPVVIKPAESWVESGQEGARFGSTLAGTLAEAQAAVEKPLDLGGNMLFQPFLSGRREAVSFLYAKGVMYASFAQWAKRTEPQLGGTSVLRQSIALPDDISDQARRLVCEIDLEGYSEVEFRRNSAGKPYLMEINPRLSASVEIAVRSGVDFPYLLYRWAHGDTLEPVRDYRKGQWMRYLKGDFFTTLEAIQQPGRAGVPPAREAVQDFLTSFFVPMNYDYVDWQDMKPAFVSMADFIQNRVSKGIIRKLSLIGR